MTAPAVVAYDGDGPSALLDRCVADYDGRLSTSQCVAQSCC